MTKETYGQVRQGVPVERLAHGISNAMAIRHAAAHAYYDTEDEVVDAARKSMFTHRDVHALGGGEFFARVTHRVINGETPSNAVASAAKAMESFFQDKVAQAIAKEKEASDERNSALFQEKFSDDLAITSMAIIMGRRSHQKAIKVGKASPTEGTKFLPRVSTSY